MDDPIIVPDTADATPAASAVSLPKPARIHFIDEVRGIDIVLMVAFHAFYTVGWLYQVEWGAYSFSVF